MTTDRDREAFEACQYAERLAASMHAKHYSDNTTWRPLSGDLIGLLTQIDNMAAPRHSLMISSTDISRMCADGRE